MASLPPDIGLWLREILELPTGDVENEIASACADTMFDVAALSRIAGANAAWATKTALEHCDIIARWRAASGQGRASALADLLSVFRTGKGEPRKCRSEEHTSELQSLMRISYAVICLKKKQIETPN